jgi:bacterioferritin (cytochrome b1)
MQGDAAVIELLNEVLTGELTAVNQYFADAKMCANWGYDRLAEKFREGELLDHILEGEEEHADWIETQLQLIRQLGEAHYLAQQIQS